MTLTHIFVQLRQSWEDPKDMKILKSNLSQKGDERLRKGQLKVLAAPPQLGKGRFF